MKIEFKNIIFLNQEIAELVRKWRNSAHIRRYMVTDHIISKKEHRKWLENLKATNNIKFWVIYFKNLPVGSASLLKIDYKNRTTDWGFYIVDESLRGKGIGSIVLFQLMRYVFDIMKFRKMYTVVLENNIVALKIYQKFGFEKEGIMKRQLFRDKKYIDLILVGMLRSQWKSKKPEIRKIVQG